MTEIGSHACCLQCREEFKITRWHQKQHRCIETVRLYHNARMLAYNRRRGIIGKSGALACCLFCRDEFICRPDRRQRTHGCKEAQEAARRDRAPGDRVKTKTRYQQEKEAEYRAVKIHENRKPCPICKVVMTVNRFACSQCLERMERSSDLDFIIASQAGWSRQLGRAIG